MAVAMRFRSRLASSSGMWVRSQLRIDRGEDGQRIMCEAAAGGRVGQHVQQGAEPAVRFRPLVDGHEPAVGQPVDGPVDGPAVGQQRVAAPAVRFRPLVDGPAEGRGLIEGSLPLTANKRHQPQATTTNTEQSPPAKKQKPTESTVIVERQELRSQRSDATTEQDSQEDGLNEDTQLPL